MSTQSIYPGVTVPKYYNAINIEEKDDYTARMEPQNVAIENRKKERMETQIDYNARLEENRKERERIRLETERNKTFCERYAVEIQCVIGVTSLIILLVLVIYIIGISLGLLVILSNYLFENTMVFLVGRATYNKNFPICINDIYQGSDCYTRTSTYCT
jgi:hypothetical protein